MFLTSLAMPALPARSEVMHANPVARTDAGDLSTGFGNDTGDLMPERQRHAPDRRQAGAIMGIGMTDAGRFDSHDRVARPRAWRGNLLQRQRLLQPNKANGSHKGSRPAREKVFAVISTGA